MTGLDEATVEASLGKLAKLGLVAYGDPPPRTMSTPPPGGGARPARSPSVPPGPVTEISEVQDDGMRRPKRALYDPSELDEDVDLERDHRQRVLDMFYKLGELDHYELLGVDRAADKKAIKRAYYERAGLYHPDRFFRKRLGSFKPKMEAVFSRVTEAHDTLVDKDKRAEYDVYLGAQSAARDIEAEMNRRLSSPGMKRSEPTVAVPPAPEPAQPASFPPERASGVHVSDQARRDALARRLLGGRPSPPPRAEEAPKASADPDALRRHYERKVSAIREHMAKEHVAHAEKAVASKDWVAATSAYRLALQVNPDDPELLRALAEAQYEANQVLAEAYRKQASYEEKCGKLEEAARSWERVARALPEEPAAHGRAALCLLKAGTDLRNAATLAQRAIALDPDAVKYRLVLAEIYLAAGLTLNAKRELEAAARLAPEDANIEALLKKAAK
ncbi:MAG TPA: DnaJ domain-containing protein [Polyangiaceae bacterium]|nr:DnaJ domain-containing protein [Polyangiaceae bacterium]